MKGASLSVFINTKAMTDREYAEEINKKAKAMLKEYNKLADEVFDYVVDLLAQLQLKKEVLIWQ